jgi:hypothetical protein
MSTIAVNVRRRAGATSARPTTREELEVDLRRAQRLAKLLDAEFAIAGFRFGLDAIFGLVPAAGDVAMLLAGLYPIHVARKHGLGVWVERKMIANLLLDFIGGAVPLVGDVFDVIFKANLRNIALLERAAAAKS